VNGYAQPKDVRLCVLPTVTYRRFDSRPRRQNAQQSHAPPPIVPPSTYHFDGSLTEARTEEQEGSVGDPYEMWRPPVGAGAEDDLELSGGGRAERTRHKREEERTV
jgi:hypothetical protein